MTPILLLVGKKGVGKDTAGEALAAGWRGERAGQCIALADAMKRAVVRMGFGWSHDVLWGPSANREALFNGDRDVVLGIDRLDPRVVAGTMLARAPFRSMSAVELLPEVHALWVSLDVRRDRLERALLTWVCTLRDLPPEQLTCRRVLQTLGTEMGRSVDFNIWWDIGELQAFRLLVGGCRYTQANGVVGAEGVIPPKFIIITDGRFRNEVLGCHRIGGHTMRITRKVEGPVSTHASELEQDTMPHAWFDWEVENDGSLEALKNRMQSFALRFE